MSNKYWLKIKYVNSDDFGDKQFNHYYELYAGERLIWSDYTIDMPTLNKVLNELKGGVL